MPSARPSLLAPPLSFCKPIRARKFGSLANQSLQAPVPPPPPLPPPPASAAAPPHVFGLEKSQLLREALEKAGPAPGSREDAKRLLKLHKDRFRSDLQWILFCADLPSLIQEGPQCGLVALWMAGTLLVPPSGIPLERLVHMAVEKGYTAQGEMFSVANMGRLAEEALGCQVELLRGGLGGPNKGRVLQHLVSGHPLLIPYDEDFNHEPCRRKGHKAHWAVSTVCRPTLYPLSLQLLHPLRIEHLLCGLRLEPEARQAPSFRGESDYSSDPVSRPHPLKCCIHSFHWWPPSFEPSTSLWTSARASLGSLLPPESSHGVRAERTPKKQTSSPPEKLLAASCFLTVLFSQPSSPLLIPGCSSSHFLPPATLTF
uniref:Actin maturation protease n=1 Tax=Pipistrellus kuhlii TaxID=59472 RepID=A0A7J7SNF7_PIPKU|nr:hypothetical protein mPipKuh1_001723 [Pipistrellus kuhlii]